MMKYFKGSLIITVLGMAMALLWGGLFALFLTLTLAILEVSLSFDNAVINSIELQSMDKKWQRRFLIWGILIAVFIVRLLLPIIIVSLVTQLNMFEVLRLAFKEPQEYAKHLTNTEALISAFGGMFLLLVFLSFLFDQNRTHYWLGTVEKKLNQLGKIAPIKIILAVFILLIIQQITPRPHQSEVTIAGILGMISFIFLKGLTHFLNQKNKNVPSKGISQFLYLEILDASFSLDGVISAFAITKDIMIILIGLTIGAILVRSLTLFLVHQKTLRKYPFLEHSAFYTIGALALMMFMSIRIHIPEILIGSISISIILLGFFSSLRPSRI